jgi:hypothetical protein
MVFGNRVQNEHSFTERFQSNCQMLKFLQAAATEVADLGARGVKTRFWKTPLR